LEETPNTFEDYESFYGSFDDLTVQCEEISFDAWLGPTPDVTVWLSDHFFYFRNKNGMDKGGRNGLVKIDLTGLAIIEKTGSGSATTIKLIVDQSPPVLEGQGEDDFSPYCSIFITDSHRSESMGPMYQAMQTAFSVRSDRLEHAQERKGKERGDPNIDSFEKGEDDDEPKCGQVISFNDFESEARTFTSSGQFDDVSDEDRAPEDIARSPGAIVKYD